MEIKIAVFEHQRKKSIRLHAYSRDYNSQWKGYCEHIVEAKNGTEAKKIAKKEHREKCMKTGL